MGDEIWPNMELQFFWWVTELEFQISFRSGFRNRPSKG